MMLRAETNIEAVALPRSIITVGASLGSIICLLDLWKLLVFSERGQIEGALFSGKRLYFLAHPVFGKI